MALRPLPHRVDGSSIFVHFQDGVWDADKLAEYNALYFRTLDGNISESDRQQALAEFRSHPLTRYSGGMTRYDFGAVELDPFLAKPRSEATQFVLRRLPIADRAHFRSVWLSSDDPTALKILAIRKCLIEIRGDNAGIKVPDIKSQHTEEFLETLGDTFGLDYVLAIGDAAIMTQQDLTEPEKK